MLQLLLQARQYSTVTREHLTFLNHHHSHPNIFTTIPLLWSSALKFFVLRFRAGYARLVPEGDSTPNLYQWNNSVKMSGASFIHSPTWGSGVSFPSLACCYVSCGSFKVATRWTEIQELYKV